MQARPPRQGIKIFLASPGDTQAARAAVVAAVEAVATESSYQHVELQLLDEKTTHPADSDVLIALFRHTLGVVLDQDQLDPYNRSYGLNPRGESWTFGEWALAQANGNPWIWRDTAAFTVEAGTSRAERRALFDQNEALEDYFDWTTEAGTFRDHVDSYDSPEALKNRYCSGLGSGLTNSCLTRPILKSWNRIYGGQNSSPHQLHPQR